MKTLYNRISGIDFCLKLSGQGTFANGWGLFIYRCLLKEEFKSPSAP